jgi:hypothetical protein
MHSRQKVRRKGVSELKKQRWRKTKGKKCDWCGKKVDTKGIYGTNNWTHKNKILYYCYECIDY